MTRIACSVSDIPEEPHWAILIFGRIHIPGDERSRTHPGHGYPERTEITRTYHVFLTEEAWMEDIRARMGRGEENFVALAVRRPRIKSTVTVEIDP